MLFRFLRSVIVILLLLSGECETQVRGASWTMGTSGSEWEAQVIGHFQVIGRVGEVRGTSWRMTSPY